MKNLFISLIICIFFPISYTYATSSGTCFDTDTKFMGHMNDTGLTDSSTSANSVTLVGGAARSGTQYKFGSYSVYMDGVGDYLTVPNSANFKFGTGDFTIDFWVYYSDYINPSGTPNHTIYDMGFVDADGIILQCDTSNPPKLRLFIGGSGIITASTGASLTTWHHMAVVRNGSGTNNVTMYMDGQSVGSGTSTTNIQSSEVIGIGGATKSPYTGTYTLYGYLDEFRVVKGTVVWTGNFTAPSAEYTNVCTSIKSVNGLAYSSCKSINGLAKASVKSINGLA